MWEKIPVRCLLTGGTIDNRYHQRLGKMAIGNNVEKMIREFRLPHHHFLIERLFKLDSRDLQDGHRAQILQAIQESREKRILITHGTDTLVDTAIYLQGHLTSRDLKSRKVVLTGAMVPYGVMGGSPAGKGGDAEANVIAAISMLDLLSPGVWISFHGRLIDPQKAYKNYQELTFFEK